MLLLSVQVDDPVPVEMLDGTQLIASPVAGLIVSESVTLFANPNWPVTVTISCPELPDVNDVATVLIVNGEVALLV